MRRTVSARGLRPGRHPWDTPEIWSSSRRTFGGRYNTLGNDPDEDPPGGNPVAAPCLGGPRRRPPQYCHIATSMSKSLSQLDVSSRCVFASRRQAPPRLRESVVLA